MAGRELSINLAAEERYGYGTLTATIRSGEPVGGGQNRLLWMASYMPGFYNSLHPFG